MEFVSNLNSKESNISIQKNKESSQTLISHNSLKSVSGGENVRS
jgi:hypothetical protein